MKSFFPPLASCFPMLCALALTACAAQGPFPSLNPRPAEYELAGRAAPPCLGGGTAAVDREGSGPPAEAVADPQLAGQLSRLVEQARRGQTEFGKLLPGARAQVGRAGRSGSDAWIAAQQEISRLEAARAPTVDALAELEALVFSRSGGSAALADREAIVAAASEASGLAEAQRTEIDRLGAVLNGASALLREPLPARHSGAHPAAGRQALAASDRGHISPAAPPRAGPKGCASRG
jgi:hypothetical protein